VIVDLGVGVGDQHLHAQGGEHRRQRAGDAAVADDAHGAAAELAADLDLGHAAGLVVGDGARDAAREVDQQAKRELDHRLHEARLGVGHQHARLRSGGDIDVADVDGAAHHDLEPWKAGKDLTRHRRSAVGDDEIDAAGHGDHARCIERRLAFVQGDLNQLLQARQGPRAVILAPRLRHMCKQKLHSG